MKSLNLIRLSILIVLTVLTQSCDVSLQIQMPEGPQGKDGLSAYELWLQGINNGDVTWNGGNDMVDFFLYLKGNDGKDGINGVDGADGLSAYELWVKQVETGTLENPHNPGSYWSIENTDMVYFWYYLTGAAGQDGKNGTNGKDGENGTNGSSGSNGSNGSNGSTGLSAYELWVIEVGKGLQDPRNPDENWSKDKTELSDFWEYLRGADGLSAYELWLLELNSGSIEWDGGNGIVDFFLYLKGKDGKDGLSAYELWVKEVKTGTLDNPHNSGNYWSTEDISMQDFWYYLTGAAGKDGKDGLSAYELWVIEVEKGTLVNPHDENGGYWITTETTLEDFWRYLRGRDGDDGNNTIDGTIIILGKPNVIARYYQQDADKYEEYVNASNGSVKYTVYDDAGEIAPGAIVNSIHYGNTTITVNLTADGTGAIWLQKNVLPTDGMSYFGACSVTYTKSDGTTATEYSPANTYIPAKVEIMVEFTSNSVSTSQTSYVRVKRSMDGGTTWENIPSYLSYNTVYIRFYPVEVDNSVADPVIDLTYSGSDITYTSTSTGLSSTLGVSFSRLIKQVPYLNTTSNAWDGNKHYYAAYVGSFYGETATTKEIVQRVPIQPIPRIKNITATSQTLDPDKNIWYLSGITGDFVTEDVDVSLLFNSVLTKNSTDYSIVPRWLPTVLSSGGVGVSMLRTYSYKTFTDLSSFSFYSEYTDILNNRIGSSGGTGFYTTFIYEGSNSGFYVAGNNYFSQTYSYTISRSATTATWELTAANINALYPAYKTITITTP